MHSILRVEHKDTKQGPYSYYKSDLVNILTDNHCYGDNGYNYPTPEKDIGIERDPHSYEFCGFKNISQLRAWFTEEEIDILKQENFIVKRSSLKDVEVTEVGERQILFCHKES